LYKLQLCYEPFEAARGLDSNEPNSPTPSQHLVGRTQLIFNLPYRRIAFGRVAHARASADFKSAIPQRATLRYADARATRTILKRYKGGEMPVDTLRVLAVISALCGENLCTPSLKLVENSIASPRGETIEVERLAVEAGQPVTFDRILLVNKDGQVSVGTPTVAAANVVADVVEHKRGKKTIASR